MPTPLLQNFGLFLGMVLGYKRMFHLAGTPQKVDKVHREICFAYFRISPTQFKSEVQLFRLRIFVNAIFCLLVIKHPGLRSRKRGRSI